MRITLLIMISELVAFPLCAQIYQPAQVFDTAGGRSSGGTYTLLSSLGQSGGITISSAGNTIHLAGFLNTFSLQPGLDTDQDGLANELDEDNDGDGLSDRAEVEGTSFNPVTVTEVNSADSDADGQNDGAEAVAGTNPSDINSLLEITSIHTAGTDRELAWVARGNNQRTYVVRAAPDPLSLLNQVVFSNTVSGGTAPWYIVTNSLLHSSVSNRLMYVVEVFATP